MPANEPRKPCMMGKLFRLLWRFHTGHHMDGRRRKSGTGKVLPQYRDYWWNRATRPRRALWRNVILGLVVLSGFGVYADRWATEYAYSACIPFVLYYLGRRYLAKFTMEVGTINGSTYRLLRPKFRRAIDRMKLWRHHEHLDEPLPKEVLEFMQADAAESHEPPILAAVIDNKELRQRARRRNRRIS